MVKKIFALVMVISVLGVVVGGCAPKEETPAETAGTTGAAPATTTTA